MDGQGQMTRVRSEATVEMIRRHEAALRRTARRYSLCAEDAEDAYQRALEIALTKAPTERPRELIRWTQTVTKHEALAIRRNRERLLGNRPSREREEEMGDWLAFVPSSDPEPGDRVERDEAVARSREALRTLKAAELRALALLAQGYSYAEISSITGFSATKVNRCLAEGRERFRNFLIRSEDGDRCREMRPMLSAFCDGELAGAEVEEMKEHLRACGNCRATLRAYRAAPGAAAALAPALLSRSILDRAHEAMAWLQARMTGGASDASAVQVAAAGGTRGAGMTALAKVLAVCAATAGSGAACVVAGVGPLPAAIAPAQETPARIERLAEDLRPAPDPVEEAPRSNPQPTPAVEAADPPPRPSPPDEAPAPVPVLAPAAEAPAVEVEPTPAPEPEPAAAPTSSGSAAGEFGP